MKSSDLKLLGSIPSPYGVSIAVWEHPDTKDDFLHDMDGCMTLAGIHGQEDRRRCEAALKAAMGGNVRFQIFMDHGGRQVPRIALPRPKNPIYPKLPRDFGMTIPIENWVTLAMEQPHWTRRAAALLPIIDSNLTHAETWDGPAAQIPEIIGLGIAHLLTASLEHLPDVEIDCLEAAAIYALTLHDEWAGPALAWLEPFRATWLADWIAARPAYQRFAAGMRGVNPDLPSWIAGDSK